MFLCCSVCFCYFFRINFLFFFSFQCLHSNRSPVDCCWFQVERENERRKKKERQIENIMKLIVNVSFEQLKSSCQIQYRWKPDITAGWIYTADGKLFKSHCEWCWSFLLFSFFFFLIYAFYHASLICSA